MVLELMQSWIKRIWFPTFYILAGVMLVKLLELTYTDWQWYQQSLIPQDHRSEKTYPLMSEMNSVSYQQLNSTTHEPSLETYSPVPRENAVFVVLCRNSDAYGIARSIRSVEDRFNHQFGYEWVFLNDVPFDENFKRVTSSLVSGKAKYGLVPKQHWSYPPWIDQSRAAAERAKAEYIYGDSESYRHMCRFFSGFFFQHELLQQYDYYWRVEPDIELWCDVDFDPFRYLRTNKKKYGFVITMPDLEETIRTLWKTVKEFFKEHPNLLARRNSKDFLTDDKGITYNGCHFWSNFEIASFDWLRSDSYQLFFNHLDRSGGFFYERWGDAPVHSIAAGLLLNQSEIHHFNEIAYSHDLYTHCPTGSDLQRQKKCYCNPAKNFDWGSLSCLPHWYYANNIPNPKGYEQELLLVQEEERRSEAKIRALEADSSAFS